MQDALDKMITIRIDRRKPTVAIAARAVGAAVAVAALSAVLRADDSTAPSPADAGEMETVVRLMPAAVVTGDSVTLADVAEVTGPGASPAGKWTVATIPSAGSSRSIEMRAVQRALAEQGVNLVQWRFHGASRCEVTAPARAEETPRTHPEEGEDNARLSEQRVLRASGVDPVDPNTLEGHLRAHLAARLEGMPGEPVFEFSPAVRDALSLSVPAYRFEIADRNERKLGLVPLEVTIYEQNRVHSTLQVLVNVALRTRVVVAARPINRQQIIELDDLTTAERVWAQVETTGLSDPARLVGQRARRFIRAQEVIALRDVESVPLIRRNDLVTVWSRQNGIVIKMVGKAMGEAGHGEAVLLKNEMSGQTFTARATGPRIAVLVTPGSQAEQDSRTEGKS